MLTSSFQDIILMEFMYVAGIPELPKTFNKKALDFGKGFLNIVWEDYMIFFLSMWKYIGLFW